MRRPGGRRGLVRVWLLAGLLAALALSLWGAACGGDDETSESEKPSAEQQASAQGGAGKGSEKGEAKGGQEGGAPKGDSREGGAKGAEGGKGGAGTGGAGGGGSEGGGGEPSQEDIAKAIEKIPPEERQRFGNTAALAVMKSFGLSEATVSVTANGYTVTVVIPPEVACGVDPSDVKEIQQALKETIISARRIRLTVQGDGRLASYIRSCPKLELPEAEGPVVFSESGDGTGSLGPFKIKSKRWTLAYENGGGNLDIYVARGDEVLKPAIESKKHEVGKQTYRGPGTFNVIVNTAGRWKIRAYDGV